MKNFYFLLLVLCLFTNTNAQIVSIPDVNFKAKLLAASPSNYIAKNLSGYWFKIDANNNSQIEVSEALQVLELNINSSNISSLVGISSFTNLQKLFCNGNQLTTLEINALVNLVELSCNHNQITTLDVSALINLLQLDCTYNQFTILNIPGLNNMKYLYCHHNQLTTLNISTLINLETLGCGDNQLTILNVSGFVNLKKLYCHYNQLTTLNVSGMNNLEELSCSGNQLTNLNVAGLNNLHQLSFGADQVTTIDVSDCLNLWWLHCNNSPLLKKIFMKNGANESSFYIEQCPLLEYICADESQLSAIQTQLNTLGYTNCILNSYCSFSPGGAFYTIEGNSKYDSNNNNTCDVLDSVFPNLKMNITDGTISGSLISDNSGNYSVPVSAGTHTLSPVLENPSYFTVFPTNVIVDFPTQTSPVVQNFCITPNGSHPDLEVTLLPIQVARPGFDAHYKIIYKNKGNQAQSGLVNLTFNDAVLDLVTANPLVSSQTINNLSWAFTGLLPFETREITFILNVNTPLESPAVNGGDILNYTTTITSSATDDTPLDNTFALNQTVVNSFDPNDKTCLEGATITPSMVGQYVHYMIRFENTGTYPAENIVVKDMIDATKFDVSTLVPTSGSHPFVTRITETNKVEFIFENINLPFDDANNDGYVAFKIKTKSTLVVGNTFSNTASIYFDYNAPIITDPAITTIAVLGTSDFEFSTYFSLYPNPTSTMLNIDLKKEIEVSSINIYNTLGQLVLVIPNAQQVKTVDVSGLTTGNYFMKLNTDKGTTTAQFIRK